MGTCVIFIYVMALGTLQQLINYTLCWHDGSNHGTNNFKDAPMSPVLKLDLLTKTECYLPLRGRQNDCRRR
jgi:hypothetical protein